jgi:hypothetical protein
VDARKDEEEKDRDGESSLMDDAKLGDTTANALSWLPRETKQHGLL